MKKLSIAAALLAVLAVGLTGCLESLSLPQLQNSNPLDPENPTTDSVEPARPRSLAAVVSNRRVELSWTVDNASAIDHYRVYRWEVEDGEDEDYELLDTTDELEYADTDVRNGQGYYYKISGVNEYGLEGKASRALLVVPQVFGVTVNQGQPTTSSRNVSLRMSASSETDLMQVSNDPAMADAQWQPYQSTYSWTLTAGDGTKTVYARFRDSGDNESGIVSDTIELDTRAVIQFVTQDSGGESLSAGDTIHFTLTANELYGEATVELGTVVPGIELYDDGTGGDSTPDDGVYERDYVIDHGVEVIEGSVIGLFTDEVGNEAEPVLAEGTVTVLDPPTAVVMQTPVALSETRMSLAWSRNNSSDFSAYKVYRSTIPGVATSPDRELIGDFSDQSRTEYTDTGLDPGSTYYYVVYVVDRAGLTSISNEVSGTTVANEPPAAVELYAPWSPDSTTLEISWGVSPAEDFDYYELIMWQQDPPAPPQTSQKRVIARLESRTETFHTHESLSSSLIYWYEVAVVDSFGARTLSNTVSGSPGP